MSVFWTVVLIGVAFFLYSQFKRESDLTIYDKNRDVIEAWVKSKNGIFENFRFTVYQNDALMVNKGSTIFVGFFDRNQGDDCGFYFELKDGQIILDKLYFPSGITSWHKTKARDALQYGVTLYELFNLAEEDHHEKFPEWKNKK